MPATMKPSKEKIIPILAMTLILVGVFSTLYVHASTADKETITFDKQDYTIEQIFKLSKTKTIQTDDGEKTGVALDDFIIKTSDSCYSCHKYTFKAKDGYQQTVDWNLIQKGIITQDRQVFFPDTAHTLWVKDIIEIKVE